MLGDPSNLLASRNVRRVGCCPVGGFVVDNDGVEDYVVYNAENGGFSVTGQNLVYVANLTTGVATAVFYTDADLNSGNAIFTVPMNASAGSVNVGVQPGTPITFSIYAFDNYFTGNLTDFIEGMRFTPGSPRFAVASDPFGSIPGLGHVTMPVTTATVPAANSTESGLLLMYRRNTPQESEIVKLQ